MATLFEQKQHLVVECAELLVEIYGRMSAEGRAGLFSQILSDRYSLRELEILARQLRERQGQAGGRA